MSKPLVQVTDESGMLVGHAPMPVAFEKELIRHTVYVIIADSEGRYLLQKRSDKVPNFKNYWDASAGGHIDEGETPEVAAYRELSEELGLDGVALQRAASFYFESEGDGRIYRYYANVYTGRVTPCVEYKCNTEEVAAVKFFSIDQISQLENVTPITRHIIAQL